ncbi:MAG: hypothetical protein AB8G77_15840 [Rhodothermales bacterium]
MMSTSFLPKGLWYSVFLLMAGCSVFEKDEPERDFMAEIMEHAATFQQEAAVRGVSVDSMMALIQFKVADEVIYEGRSLCGFAPWYDDPETGEPTITIVTSGTCWVDRSEQDNEALVFHELGHMVLDRNHRDELLPNNSRSSIMVGSNLAGLYVGNVLSRRSYYIDELFDATTPVPDWAQ